MPVVEYQSVVAAPEADLWAFVSIMDSWAPFMLGYRSHRVISDVESVWTLQGDTGLLSRTLELRVQITEWVELTRVSFTLEGLNEHVNGTGTFTMKRAAGQQSEADRGEPAPRRWWYAIIRLLFRRQLQAEAPRATTRRASTGGDRTELNFTLSLRAGGMMGPMLDAIIEPLLLPAAETLAGKIAARVETQRAPERNHRS